jgi:RNA polymerase sigma-70 factor (sigma-E family)
MNRRDDGKFLEFAAAYRPQMCRTAYLMCGDWDRAADIAQEALIRLYVAWPRIDLEAGLRSYARRTVVNAAIDIRRKRSSGERPTPVIAHGSVEDPTVAVADRMLIMDALAQLPTRQRACVVLRYYEDLSVEAVAEVLGCRTGTVKSQTARGLATLRALFNANGDALVADIEPTTEVTTW